MNQKAQISYFDKLESNMPPVTIVWHARGNQGAVGASAAIVNLIFQLTEEGQEYDATSAQIFGAAKEGEPIRAYNRISKDKIEVFYTPAKLDVIIIVDPTISRNVLLQGAHQNTIYLINTNESPEKIARDLKLGPRRIVTVDATKIAKEELKSKRSHPNTTMLGSLVHVFPFFTMEFMAKTIENTYEEKGHAVVEANKKAMMRGFAEAMEYDGRASDIPFEALNPPKKFLWNEILPNGAVLAAEEPSPNKTGAWRTERPIWDPEKCIHCLSCDEACADKSILSQIDANGLRKMIGIDYDYCKGCAACSNVCPVKAILMISEAEAKKCQK